MALRKRRFSHFQRHAIVTLLCLPAAAVVADGNGPLSLTPPTNSLRGADSKPAEPASQKTAKPTSVVAAETPVTAPAVTLVPIATHVGGSSVLVNPPASANQQASEPETRLVSDGWLPRRRDARPVPLAPLATNASSSIKDESSSVKAVRESKATSPAADKEPAKLAPLSESKSDEDWKKEPKSTLRFILPKQPGAYPQQSPAKSDAVSQPFEKSAAGSGEFDPEQNEPPTLSAPETGKTSDPASSVDAVAEVIPGEEATEKLPTEPSDLELEPIVAPESSDADAMHESSGANAEGDEEPAQKTAEEGCGDESADPASVAPSPSDGARQGGKVQVRPLLLGNDGSLRSDAASKPSPSGDASLKSINDSDALPLLPGRIATNTRSSDAKQSVGDEPVKPAPTSVTPRLNTAINVDRVGPNGELVLAIGMSPSPTAITPAAARMRVPIERTLAYYWSKPEDAQERTYWGMFHNIMIYDKDTAIISNRRRFNAVAWMAGNNPCRNQVLFEEDAGGINVKSGVGLQGHQAQLLAVFGLIDVPASYPIYVGRRKYSVNDVIKREMLACKPGAELTFTLIGLSHYVDTDTRWVAEDGQDWDFERLIEEELAQPIVGAACGGTHRLMGFAHALRRRRAEGKPITGQWDRADQYVKEFIDYTWQLQNRDGSMSTAWFEKPEDNDKMDRKIQTTGHMLEFLLTAVPDDQLQSSRMIRTVNYLTNTLYEERGHDWQVGPKGHALRALAMYYRRVYGRPDPWRPAQVARHNHSHSR